jgi:alanine-alpha-ketoisovalerate/valine-pyruvate aminotransferase
MSARWNPTQAELNRAIACRSLEAMELSAAVRDAIRPIFRRRIARLAAMITAQPIGERRSNNRRARRAGR